MIHIEKAVLLTVKPVDFVARDTGQEFKGCKIILCRPSHDVKFEGYGMHVYYLRVPGSEGLALANQFNTQANGLYMRSVDIECELRQYGKKWEPYPMSIRGAA